MSDYHSSDEEIDIYQNDINNRLRKI